jgi:hypothetical protein
MISFIFVLLLGVVIFKSNSSIIENPTTDISFSFSSELHAKKNCHPVQYIPPFRRREDLAFILAAENKTIAAELGVKEGDFASDIINRWKTAKKYVLVDYWAHQENYIDGANVPDAVHNEFYKYAMNLMRLVKDKGFVQEVEVCRNFTNVCVHNYESGYFDFIYVDARHDYKVCIFCVNLFFKANFLICLIHRVLCKTFVSGGQNSK